MTTDSQQGNGQEQGFASGWGSEYADKKPRVGDSIAGEVIGIEMSTGGGYGAYPIITVLIDKQSMPSCKSAEHVYQPGEERNIHAFHTVLRGNLARKNVQYGDRIAVKYLGTVQGGSFDKGYENYSVRSNATPREFDWSAEGGDAPEQQRSADPPIAAAPTPSQMAGAGQGAPPPQQTSFPPPEPAAAPAGAQFGDEAPFFWEPPADEIWQLKGHSAR